MGWLAGNRARPIGHRATATAIELSRRSVTISGWRMPSIALQDAPGRNRHDARSPMWSAAWNLPTDRPRSRPGVALANHGAIALTAKDWSARPPRFARRWPSSCGSTTDQHRDLSDRYRRHARRGQSRGAAARVCPALLTTTGGQLEKADEQLCRQSASIGKTPGVHRIRSPLAPGQRAGLSKQRNRLARDVDGGQPQG